MSETLAASRQASLRATPTLFSRTLLVISYDEHGGFYDRLDSRDQPAVAAGSWGGRCPSLGGYVTGTAATRKVPAAGGR